MHRLTREHHIIYAARIRLQDHGDAVNFRNKWVRIPVEKKTENQIELPGIKNICKYFDSDNAATPDNGYG